jgi:acyl carrier protein
MRMQNEESSRQAAYERPDSGNGAAGSLARTTVTESEMTKIWEDVLETKGIGRDDDFFDLGGTSLGLIRIFGLIKEHFGVALEVDAAIEAATIAHLSTLVDGRANATS